MIRVRTILADDHPLVRAGLRMMLESMDEIEVIGEAEDGHALLAMAEKLQPGLILMDIAMPGLNGLEATARLANSKFETKIVILSMHRNEAYVRRALRNGAAGYVLKDAAPIELNLALKAVLRGEAYFSSAVTLGIMSDYAERLRADDQPDGALSPRQREVLQLLAEGYSNKDIARRLDISVNTVNTHRSQLMKQLNIHEITGLVRYAMRNGLISPES